MEKAVFTLLFVATAPIGLMPTIVALFTRHLHRLVIAALNLVAWALGYLSIRSLIDPQADPFVIPVPVFAVAWLILVAWSFKGPHRAKTRGVA